MPHLAHRSLGKIIGAAAEKRHYTALFNMMRLSGSFGEVLYRYLTGKGAYPYRVSVKTPIGTIQPTLYSYYDLLTLNEIFFREDYAAAATDSVIVDIGSNIGLSALYFLTRNENSICHLYEPDPRNIHRLKENLSAFASRCVINDCAVAEKDGIARFALDVISGRYGSLVMDHGNSTMVRCEHINRVLADVLNKYKRIDVLKIDTEGTEMTLLNAIDPDFLGRIGKIYCEASASEAFHPELYKCEQYGTVYRLTLKLGVV